MRLLARSAAVVYLTTPTHHWHLLGMAIASHLGASAEMEWPHDIVCWPRHRLVEDADFRAAQELFGGGGDLQKQKLKTMKEHENYGKVCVHRRIICVPQRDGP